MFSPSIAIIGRSQDTVNYEKALRLIGASPLIKEICAAASDVIYIVELVFSIPLMGSRIFNMLTNRTAKMNVDDLHALTDTEYGFVPLDEKIKGLKLNDIQFCINLPGTMIVLSEKGRGNVSAAG